MPDFIYPNSHSVINYIFDEVHGCAVFSNSTSLVNEVTWLCSSRTWSRKAYTVSTKLLHIKRKEKITNQFYFVGRHLYESENYHFASSTSHNRYNRYIGLQWNINYLSSTTIWLPCTSSTIIFSSSAIRIWGDSSKAEKNSQVLSLYSE